MMCYNQITMEDKGYETQTYFLSYPDISGGKHFGKRSKPADIHSDKRRYPACADTK